MWNGKVPNDDFSECVVNTCKPSITDCTVCKTVSGKEVCTECDNEKVPNDDGSECVVIF